MTEAPVFWVDPSAVVGANCVLGYGAVVEAGAVIGAGCTIGHHAVVCAGVQLGAGCHVEPHAVLGRRPRPAVSSTVRPPDQLAPLTIGAGARIGAGAVVYAGTVIGSQCLLGEHAFVREGCAIGDRVVVGTHVTVENEVSIGNDSKLQTGAYIAAWTTIEAHCFIAPCVVTSNDNFMGRSEARFAQRGGPVIRRGARVGANVTLLPNVVVGAEAFVAAGSLVTRDVPPGQVVMGSPARVVRAVPAGELLDAGHE